MKNKKERNALFTQLLIDTNGTAHGTRPNYQEDSEGLVWFYEVSLDRKQATQLMVVMSEGHIKLLPWSREFMLMWGDEIFVYALYNRNGDYYLIRSRGDRYYHWMIRNYRERTTAQDKVCHLLGSIYGYGYLTKQAA